MASATTTKGGAGRGSLGTIGFYVFLVLFVLVSLFPLLWVFRMSTVTKSDLLTSPSVTLTASPVGTSYSTVFSNPDFIQALQNSVIVAGTTTVICLFFGSICAYSIARLRFRFKGSVMTVILAISFFPAVAIIAPLFIQFTAVGIINTYWAMIIPDVVFALPLTIIHAWNEFLFANTFIFDAAHYPVTVVIPNFATTYTTDYGAQAAGAVVVTVPLVILVLIFQRRIVSGLTAGAVKG